jgi:hypothetical protein
VLGVNAVGQEADNAIMCQGRTIPWLQDVGSQQVWTSWRVTYRDVVVLDQRNQVTAVYNLTAHDLADPVNRETLKGLIRDAAGR